MGKWSVIDGSVVRGFNKTPQKSMFGVMISPVHFVRGLFCYSNFNFFYVYDKEETNFRNSHPVVKKGVLRNFAKFTGKHLCQSLFFDKVAGLR